MMLARKGKKMLAMLLALVMLLGLLPVSAMAVDGTSGTVVSEKTEWTYSPDEKVAHRKTIEKTGENQFEITLEVKTSEEIKTQVLSPDAAVVLVMDVSNSMKETVDGKNPQNESDQRIYKAKAAAKNFIDSFAADADGAQRKVALVEFGSSAYTVQGWTDPGTASAAVDRVGISFSYPSCTITGQHTHDVNTIEWGGFLGLQWRCTVEGCPYYKSKGILNWDWYTLFDRAYEGHTHEQTFDGPHGDTLSDGGGTNIEAGLQLADNLLGSSDVSGIDNCYVVLITDGVPTYHVYQNRDKSSMTFIEGQAGGGNYAQPADYQNVPVVASSIKDNATLYTVSYASDQVRDTVGGMRIDAWLASFANKNVAAGDDIDWGLSQISSIIKDQAQAWILTDPIPAQNFIVYRPEDNSSIPDVTVNPDYVITYDSQKGELVWNLKGDTPVSSEKVGDVTWHTYRAKYTIRLDTAARGFVEDKAYETNGTTTLKYMLTQDGQLQPGLKETKLVVPAVSGKIPSVMYTVTPWYQDRDSGQYVTGQTVTKSAKLWDYAEIDSADYLKTGYEFDHGDEGRQQLTADGMNFDLYYKCQSSTLTVNHYYREIVVGADGTPAIGEYELETTTYDGRQGDLNYPLYAGERYTIGAEGNLGLITTGGYSLESTSLGGRELTVELTPNGNTVDLYYSRTVDNSEAHVTVTHTYNNYSWVVETDQSSPNYGKLVPKLTASVDVPVTDTTVRLADQKSYSADLTANESYKNYVYVDGSAASTSDPDVTVDSGKATIDLKVGENDLNLTFEYVPVKPTTVSFTVEYYYTKNVTTVVNGEISHEGSFTNELGYTETITDCAPGEYYTLQQKTEYNDDIFTPAADNAGKLTGAAVDGEVIKLYYTLDESPAESTLTVVHVYRAWERYTEDDGVTESIRPATGVTVPESVTVEYPLSGTLYQGQNVTVTLKGEDGYTFTPSTDDGANIGPDAPVSDIAADGEKVPAQGQTIYVYYDAIPSDARDDAEITIVHHYTTLLDTVIGGVVTEDYRRDDGTSTETLTGRAGDTYSITERLEHEVGNESYTYSCVTSHVATGTFHSGTNTTIDLYYERSDSDLQAVTYDVVYEYYRQEMTFNDEGVAGYWDEPQKVAKPSGAPDDVTNASAYLGQKVNLTDGAVGNYTAYGENNLAPVIDEDNKQIVLSYVEKVSKTPTTITVQHHYLETVLNADNTVKETIDHTSGPVEINVFVAQSYVAEAAVVSPYGYDRVEVSDNLSGYTQNDAYDVTVTIPDGTSSIDFYYTWTNDSAVSPASYTINHYYRTVDWNEDAATKDYDPIGTGASYKTEGSSYAGLTITGTPDLKVDSTGNPVYTLDSATSSSAFQGENYTIVLASGSDNVINFYYTQHIDSRVGNETRVEVIHNYYARDTFTDVDDMSDADYIAQEGVQPESRATMVYTTIADGAWIGNSFTAIQYPDRYTPDENGEATVKVSYEFVNADPEGGKIDSLAAVTQEQPNPNVIVINYIRDYSSQPNQVELTVNHQYYLDGVLQENLSASENHSVAYGASVTAADYAQEKDGYSLDRSDAQSQDIASMTAAASITLKYYRTTPTEPGGDGGSDTTYYKVVVKYLEEGTEQSLRSDYSVSVMETHSYDVTSRTELDIAGYDRTDVTGDSLSMEHIDSDKEIIVWYVSNGGNGGDDGGETDIPDPSTPLGPNPDGTGTGTGTGTGDGGTVDIGEPSTPLGPGPDGTGTGTSTGTGTGSGTEIEDAGVPKGDLPQTGAVAAPVNPTVTAGLLALSMSMAALGLTFTFGRKKGEEED